MKQTSIGIFLYIILLIPSVSVYMESIMVLHMLVQLPMLILVGWLIGKKVIIKYKGFFDKWNANGIPGIVLVVFISMYWMLPRALDESLTVLYIQLFKFAGLPLLVGIPLRDSWHKLHSLAKSFVYLNYLPMFGLMAWLYIDTPIQICNNYLLVQQRALGWALLILTAAMIIYLVQVVFTDQSEVKS
ncbi:hypothetical protein QGM71_09570 [Virgibacillus sp. C22-A2]|uniref:Uncharacterized protein n=1 Tax=Virgibacillus tibetensis TaxID=3042313 RepID=A0ABU6KEI8_9BACI|nr:hypothetical protein [Virgibacillus sp. C22-A2]